MAVLVTGGSGLVGLNVVEHLLTRGEDVVSMSTVAMPRAAERRFAKQAGQLACYSVDVLDLADWDVAAKRNGVDRIVHCAAITPKDERERRDFAQVAEVNVMGTVAALQAARRWGVRRFVHCSSAAVYGANAFDSAELEESACAFPQTLYAITKFASEGMVLRYGELWNLDVVVARLGTVFGRWEHDTGVRDMLSAPLQTAEIAERGGLAVLPHEGLRDWIYGPDVARALVGLLELPRHKWNVYNVGAGQAWSMLDWCAGLRKRFPAFRYRVAADDVRANVDFHSARDRSPLCIRRIQEDLDFRPAYDLMRACDDFIEWRESMREEKAL